MVNRKLSIAERRILKGYMENGEYNKDVSQVIRRPHVAQAMRDALELQGLTDDLLAAKAKSLLNAKETKFFQCEGRVTDEREVDAHGIQLQTLTLIGKWKGLDRQAIDLNHSGYISDKQSLSDKTDEELDAIIADAEAEGSPESQS